MLHSTIYTNFTSLSVYQGCIVSNKTINDIAATLLHLSFVTFSNVKYILLARNMLYAHGSTKRKILHAIENELLQKENKGHLRLSDWIIVDLHHCSIGDEGFEKMCCVLPHRRT